MKLDLACGLTVQEGYEGVDIVDNPGVAHVVNLFEPWPWAEDSIDAIWCSHFVEHIPDLVGFMAEMYRVCRDGAEVVIHHPYQFHVRAWQDPTHVRALNEISFFYYDKKWRGDLAGDADRFGNIDFEVVECDAIPSPEWAQMAKDSPEKFEAAAHNQINVVSDLHWVLRCRKG